MRNKPNDSGGTGIRKRMPDPAQVQGGEWRFRHPTLLGCVLLFSVVLWTFFPAVDNDFVGYDDPDYVTDNLHVRGGLTWSGIAWAFRSVEAANWHPLTWCSHMLDCQLFGLQPWGHHLVAILIHACNVCLLFLLLQRMTGVLSRSLLVAAFFGLHPLRVESVAWVAERKDVLSAFFFLITLWMYVHYVQESVVRGPWSVAGGARSDDRGRRADSNAERLGDAPASGFRLRTSGSYVGALACFGLGLMCKSMLVTLPFVMLLLDYWPLGRVSGPWSVVSGRKAEGGGQHAEGGVHVATGGSHLSLSLVSEKVPFFALALASAVVTFFVQKGGGAMIAVPFQDRVQNAVVSFGRYLARLFWPVNLSVFYPYPEHWPAGMVIGATLLFGAITALAWFRRRRSPWLAVGWFWFVGMLVPVIGLVQAGEQSMADRYSYLPSIGVGLALVWTVAEAGGHYRIARFVAPALAVVAVVMSVAVTRKQLGFWKDNETLFRHAIAVTSGNYLAHINLGTALDHHGELEAAAEQYQFALKERPNYSKALTDLGAVRGRQGRVEEAIELCLQSVAVGPKDPVAWNNLGVALSYQRRWGDAETAFRRAIAIKPDYADAHFNLASAYSRSGAQEEAIREWRASVALDPNASDAHNSLGLALDQRGDLDEAISEFEAAWRLDPGSVDIANNLGVAFGKKGRLDDAIRVFRWCIQAQPTAAKYHFNLGVMLARAGQSDQSIEEFREALKIKPDYGEAQKNLEEMLKAKGESGRGGQPQR